MKSSNDKGGDEESKKRNADNTQGGNWKKKFKKALKTDKGLKTVMSILASEEKNNMAFVEALTSAIPSTSNSTKIMGKKVSVSALKTSIPARSLKLQTILKSNAKDSEQE